VNEEEDLLFVEEDQIVGTENLPELEAPGMAGLEEKERKSSIRKEKPVPPPIKKKENNWIGNGVGLNKASDELKKNELKKERLLIDIHEPQKRRLSKKEQQLQKRENNFGMKVGAGIEFEMDKEAQKKCKQLLLQDNLKRNAQLMYYLIPFSFYPLLEK
jgi:hypothetical protein